jgi:hypothetical protein
MGRTIFKLETRVGDIIVLVAKNEAEARKNASEYSSRFRVNYRDIKCVKIGKALDYLALARNYAFKSSYCEIITIIENKSEDETIKRTEELVKELKASIETAVKNAKIFINDIQDGGDYAFACGIVSALKFIVDEETHTELEELLEKQSKWEQTRNIFIELNELLEK